MFTRGLTEGCSRSGANGRLLLIVVPCVLLACAGAALGASPWPEGLLEAVQSHLQVLQVSQYRIRDSGLENPVGVEPMVVFDRTSHRCHEEPGQAYRVYRLPTSFRKDKDGSIRVVSGFDLFHRQAGSVAEVFTRSWQKGSDGALEVRLEMLDGGWEVVGSREILEGPP